MLPIFLHTRGPALNMRPLILRIICFGVSLLSMGLFLLAGGHAQTLEGMQKQASSPQTQGSPRQQIKSFRSPSRGWVGDGITGPEFSEPKGGGLQQMPVHYSIHVLGEVTRPGTYRILPSDRVTDAISYAGGIVPSGSARLVQLRRQGTTKIIDIFLYRMRGWVNQNPYLMENDVVYVPFKKGEFEIQGPVSSPGRYEYTRPTSLTAVVDLAGGFTVGRSLKDSIRVIRFNEQETKEVIEVKNHDQDLKKFTVEKGDIIVVPHVLITKNTFDYDVASIPGDNLFYPSSDDQVYVTGSVLHPGPYPFQPHSKAADYVSLAGAHKDSKIKNLKIIKTDNKKRMQVTKNTIINPGDTIYVPGRYWRAETVAQWLSTLSSITLSSIVIVDRLGN